MHKNKMNIKLNRNNIQLGFNSSLDFGEIKILVDP